MNDSQSVASRNFKEKKGGCKADRYLLKWGRCAAVVLAKAPQLDRNLFAQIIGAISRPTDKGKKKETRATHSTAYSKEGNYSNQTGLGTSEDGR